MICKTNSSCFERLQQLVLLTVDIIQQIVRNDFLECKLV